MFDPNQYVNAEVTGALATEAILIPEGDFIGTIIPVEARNFREVNTNDGPRAVCDITFEFSDEKIQEVTKRSRNTCRYTIWLDTTDSGGLSMEKGLNIGLGRLREAVKQNWEDKPWSFNMLGGRPALCAIKHSLSKGVMYANVTDVAPVGSTPKAAVAAEASKSKRK